MDVVIIGHMDTDQRINTLMQMLPNEKCIVVDPDHLSNAEIKELVNKINDPESTNTQYISSIPIKSYGIPELNRSLIYGNEKIRTKPCKRHEYVFQGIVDHKEVWVCRHERCRKKLE